MAKQCVLTLEDVTFQPRTHGLSHYCVSCFEDAVYEAVCGSAHIGYCNARACKRYAAEQALEIATIVAREQENNRNQPFDVILVLPPSKPTEDKEPLNDFLRRVLPRFVRGLSLRGWRRGGQDEKR